MSAKWKYILLTLAVFTLFMALLISIVVIFVRNYDQSLQEDNIISSLQMSKDNTEDLLFFEGTDDIETMVDHNWRSVQNILRFTADTIENGGIVLVDTLNTVIMAEGEVPVSLSEGKTVSTLDVYEARTSSDVISLSHLDVLSDDSYYIFACSLTYDSSYVGMIIAFTPLNGTSTAAMLTTQSLLVSLFWIFGAVFIAIYFLVDHMTVPMRNIRAVSLEVLKGNYDVKLPVYGKGEYADIASAFNSMAVALQKNDSGSNSFLADVAHDLRTPMTAISGFVDEIIEDVIPPERQKEYLQLVSTEVKRLSRMINTLLEVTRIENNRRKFVMKPFNLSEMARQILVSFEQKIDAKFLEVEFVSGDEDLYVSGDYDAIYQIVYNLCDNAVKFSKEHGLLRMTLSTLKKESKAQLSVYNEGIGIDPKEIPYIFDRFYKGDKSRGKDKTGIGLGLYISKTIMDAHAGQIWVKSVYGANCEFGIVMNEIEKPQSTEK